jgi:hypothetical protein
MLALVEDSERDTITEIALTALDSYYLHRSVFRSSFEPDKIEDRSLASGSSRVRSPSLHRGLWDICRIHVDTRLESLMNTIYPPLC